MYRVNKKKNTFKFQTGNGNMTTKSLPVVRLFVVQKEHCPPFGRTLVRLLLTHFDV